MLQPVRQELTNRLPLVARDRQSVFASLELVDQPVLDLGARPSIVDLVLTVLGL